MPKVPPKSGPQGQRSCKATLPHQSSQQQAVRRTGMNAEMDMKYGKWESWKDSRGKFVVNLETGAEYYEDEFPQEFLDMEKGQEEGQGRQINIMMAKTAKEAAEECNEQTQAKWGENYQLRSEDEKARRQAHVESLEKYDLPPLNKHVKRRMAASRAEEELTFLLREGEIGALEEREDGNTRAGLKELGKELQQAAEEKAGHLFQGFKQKEPGTVVDYDKQVEYFKGAVNSAPKASARPSTSPSFKGMTAEKNTGDSSESENWDQESVYYGIGRQISEGSGSDNMKVRFADREECQHCVDKHNEFCNKKAGSREKQRPHAVSRTCGDSQK